MRAGRRLGIDVGKARVGVAASDPHGMLAMPLETVQRTTDDTGLCARINELATEYDAIELVVGLPLSLSGADTHSTKDAREVAALLAAGRIPVRMVDERMSTVTAERGMRAAGRTAKAQRSVVDQAAAVVILQHALDVERASGSAPGFVLPVEETREP